MSLKRFEGWTPVTRYEYDDAGRLISSTTESEWDEEQQSWMLALTEYRDSLCPCGCGHQVRDTTADETSVEFRVLPPARCLARDALSMAQQAHNRERPEALIWRTVARRKRGS